MNLARIKCGICNYLISVPFVLLKLIHSCKNYLWVYVKNRYNNIIKTKCYSVNWFKIDLILIWKVLKWHEIKKSRFIVILLFFWFLVTLTEKILRFKYQWANSIRQDINNSRQKTQCLRFLSVLVHLSKCRPPLICPVIIHKDTKILCIHINWCYKNASIVIFCLATSNCTVTKKQAKQRMSSVLRAQS